MTAVQSKNVDAFIAKPPIAQPVVLVFGPDAGLVRERAEALIRASVDDINDPFSLARLAGDDLASDPTRLVEEANTIPLFGGRRAVWVKAGARNFAPVVEALLAATSPECRVVIEAGELRKNAPLRVLCERAKNAAALPCYIDDAAALARLVDDEMGAANLTITPDARAALVPLLGGDRLASRSEINKVALYARGNKVVEREHVMAIVSDASDLMLDALVDAVFAGRIPEVEFQFAKARTAGTSPGSILSAAQRHVAMLHKTRLAVDDGASAEEAFKRSYLHFTREKLVVPALKSWTSARLERAMSQIAEATFESRKQADLAEAIAQRTLLSLAMNARRKE
jgi:DNA polymerase III subunit delta